MAKAAKKPAVAKKRKFSDGSAEIPEGSTFNIMFYKANCSYGIRYYISVVSASLPASSCITINFDK